MEGGERVQKKKARRVEGISALTRKLAGRVGQHAGAEVVERFARNLPDYLAEPVRASAPRLGEAFSDFVTRVASKLPTGAGNVLRAFSSHAGSDGSPSTVRNLTPLRFFCAEGPGMLSLRPSQDAIWHSAEMNSIPRVFLATPGHNSGFRRFALLAV